MSIVRTAAVAGSFYPAHPQALRQALAGHLAAAGSGTVAERCPKIVLAPHAGYVYSGDVAALAYAPLARWRDWIRRVVLLGPVHRVPVRGLAAPTAAAFETPLGEVPLDLAALASLRDLDQIVFNDRPHGPEHSLEVQLPFLQTVLADGFKLVPLAVGDATPAEVAEVIERLWGGDETLIVISSDLSHYLPYAQAQAVDRVTAQRIVGLATDLVGEEACGAAPLNGALLAARRRRLAPRLLGLRNSADIPGGDRRRVVGYGAVAFDPPAAAVGVDDDAALGQALVQAARRSIADALKLPRAPAAVPDHPEFSRPGATFVTLHDAQSQLRGCVGRLEAVRPLGEDVRANAYAAAFEDHRFAPLRAHEWDGLQVEVSLLDPAEPLPARDEAQALASLRPGIDGLILHWRHLRATFLPQVWAQLPEPAQFMAALKRKAGLAADFWAVDIRLSRYRVRSFADHEYPEALH
jgi:AmmeMemoRadiSam system protein B/AmmeMemoRadiSam system protein A